MIKEHAKKKNVLSGKGADYILISPEFYELPEIDWLLHSPEGANRVLFYQHLYGCRAKLNKRNLRYEEINPDQHWDGAFVQTTLEYLEKLKLVVLKTINQVQYVEVLDSNVMREP